MLIVLCLIATSLLMWVGSEASHNLMGLIPFIIGLLVVAGWLVLFYLRMHDSIVVTEDGLTYEPASGQPRVVPWHQIAKLAPHSLRGRYDVLDFVAVLVGYAISGERTLQDFYEAVQPFASAFMALFGRTRLPV